MRRLLAAFRRQPFDDLLIACFPKSGSTYLSKVLQHATGLQEAYIAEFGPQNEQDIVRRKLKRLWRRSVLQQHLKGTRTNLEYLTTFGIRPIVQTRSLFDVVISLYDHFERDSNSLPCGQISAEYWQMCFQDRLDYLICFHLPWYYNFYMSWRDAAHKTEIFPLTYEDLFADQVGRLTEVLKFYHFSRSESQIQAAIDKTANSKTRFNVGVNGRGLQMLSKRHQQSIARQAATCRLELNERGSIVTPLLPDAAQFVPRTSATVGSFRSAAA
jgi:LPS sulfotransferase NodH